MRCGNPLRMLKQVAKHVGWHLRSPTFCANKPEANEVCEKKTPPSPLKCRRHRSPRRPSPCIRKGPGRPETPKERYRYHAKNPFRANNCPAHPTINVKDTIGRIAWFRRFGEWCRSFCNTSRHLNKKRHSPEHQLAVCQFEKETSTCRTRTTANLHAQKVPLDADARTPVWAPAFKPTLYRI